jgi:hypothetical protein
MRLFLDTEFNSTGGELISLALVGDDGSEFYEVIGIPDADDLHPWVAEHVIPLLGKAPIGAKEFRRRLEAFLVERPGALIVADWPDDIGYLCLAVGGMMRRVGAMQCQILPDQVQAIKPEIPHNALSDARALMRSVKARAA